MSDYKCIIWDWNGTLLNDVPLNMRIVNMLLNERGVRSLESEEYYKSEFSFPIIDFYRKIGFDLENEDFTLIAREYARLFDEGYPEADIFPDAEQMLYLIKHSGREQLIISASEQGYLLKQVEYFELSHYFTDILGVSDVLGSSKIERAKGWIKERGIDPKEVLFIGDTDHDLSSAKAMGADCILVACGHQSYETLCRCHDKVLHNMRELFDVLFSN